MAGDLDLTAESLAEAQEVAEALPLEDESVLGALQEAIKDAYLEAESQENQGAVVHLDALATAIWDEAVRIAFERWLRSRDAAVAERIAERIEAESDRRDQPGLTWAAETSTHRKAGWDAGMTTAARIAREVGSDG